MQCLLVFQNLFPARGRKPVLDVFVNGVKGTSGVFQNLFPARGRKLAFVFRLAFKPRVFQNLFPARGRKQFELDPCGLVVISLVFQNLFPARGRKHSLYL